MKAILYTVRLLFLMRTIFNKKPYRHFDKFRQHPHVANTQNHKPSLPHDNNRNPPGRCHQQNIVLPVKVVRFPAFNLST